MVMNPKRILSAAFVVSALALGTAAADVPTCSRHLSVELTADVPNPRDLAFLGSLLTQPGSVLAWRGQKGYAIELELTGPGRDDRCRAVIAAMRKDGRVQSITVTRD
jgi:hypothetical protein